ncbi:MAG: magnesium chelatase subunit D [Parvularculaceae bacterium]
MIAAAQSGPGCLARRAAELLCVDPVGLKGAVVRSPPSPWLDRWLSSFRAGLAPDTPWRKLPPGAALGRLAGGLDLSASLSAGKPLFERGLLAEADGGVVLAPMAERMEVETAGILAAALDDGFVRTERDGFSRVDAARFCLLLIDEGVGADEAIPRALAERVGFIVDPVGDDGEACDPEDLRAARQRLAGVEIPDALIEALAVAALRFGVISLRVLRFAVAAARASAALAGRARASAEDAALGAALVIAPRAVTTPSADDAQSPPETSKGESAETSEPGDRPLADQIVAATKATIDAALLSGAVRRRGAVRSAGKSGAMRKSLARGRPYGSRPGDPSQGGRLQLMDTLRAAAPWRKIRGRPADGSAIDVRREDLRIARFRRPEQSLAIFVVDASGSAAMQRLAETKGAIEHLFARSYSRRDEVALIAFRKVSADLLVPPTRSLTRARRLLAELPGGGGTPLAAGIDAATALAAQAVKRGRTPTILFMTDGRANVALNGEGGRDAAQRDALAAAKRLRGLGARVIVVDTAARPEPLAAAFAAEMGALYLQLPYCDGARVAAMVARR